MLLNPAYIGLFIWNRTTKVFNWETQKFDVVKNPWQAWEIYYDPSLALVPKAWHVDARNRLEKPRADKNRKKRKQPQRMPPTLFSGTILCRDCAKELNLCRSTNRYKSLGCLNGIAGRHGCTLTKSKSTNLIEKKLLAVISEQILSPENLKVLCQLANKYLVSESKKPPTDVKPLKKKEKQLRADVERLLGRVKSATSEALIETYEAEIVRIQEALKLVCAEIMQSERSNSPPPPQLDLNRVATYVKDARAILGQEIPAAAEALRRLTGPILASQQPHPHTNHGARWTLTFTPEALPFLRDLSVRLDYPETPTLEFLCTGNWITAEPVALELDSSGWVRSPRLAPATLQKVQEMLSQPGEFTNAEIAKAAGCSPTSVFRRRQKLQAELPR